LPQDIDHIRFVEADVSPIVQEQTSITVPNNMATTIDVNPDIMIGADPTTGNVQYYYYDQLSGTLSDIPVDNDSIAIPKDKLDDMLLQSNISKESISQVVEKIANVKKKLSTPEIQASRTTVENVNIEKLNEEPTSTPSLTIAPSDSSNSSSSTDYTWVIVGTVLGVVFVIAIIVAIVMYTRMKSKSA
jgi:tetrahydromethanopterin S-methyltransferase subunit B